MKLIVVMLLTFAIGPVAAQDLLANKLNDIQMPEFSLEEKRTTLENVILLVEQANVNRRVKIEKYGSGIDPLPKLKALRPQLARISTLQLQKQISNIILSQRDLHLNYYLPKPYACYLAQMPFWMDIFLKQSPKGGLQEVLAIKRVFGGPRFLDLFNEQEKQDFAKLQVGDLVLEFNALNFREDIAKSLESVANLGQGANAHASLLRAVRSLTLLNFMDTVPSLDDQQSNPRLQVRLLLKNRQDQEYEVRLPWVVFASETCLQSTQEEEPENNDDEFSAKQIMEVVDSGLIPDEFESFQLHSEIEMINYPAKNKDQFGLQWGVIHHFDANYGYIRIPSFRLDKKVYPWPETENEGKGPYSSDLLGQLSDILQTMNNQYQVRGLVLDVRNNGGGSLLFAESMVQFFSPRTVYPKKYRLLNSPFNRSLSLETEIGKNPDEDFKLTLKTTPTNAVYGKAIPMLGDVGKDYDNRYGQMFYKPVVVLTNSACYSACDGFTAMMQDHGVGKIWSEGRRTGGGGANVIESRRIQAWVDDNPVMARYGLKPFLYGQGMRVPWRQIIRTGLNDGKRLEEDGVVADRAFLPTYSDLINNQVFPLDELIEHFEIENWMQSLEFTVQIPEYFFTAAMADKFLKLPLSVEGVGHVRVERVARYQYQGMEEPQESLAFNIALDGSLLTEIEIPLPANQVETDLLYRITGKQGAQIKFNRLIQVARAPLAPGNDE